MLRILIVVTVFVLFFAACSVERPAPSMAPHDVLNARNAALAYIQANYLIGPGPGFSWQEAPVIDDSSVDWTEYEYTAASWIITVDAPAAAPKTRHCDIAVTNPSGIPF